MNVNDQLKAKIDEIDVDAKITQLTETATALLATVKEQAASLVGENRTKVDEIIEKATAVLDEKTEGKYHDKVEKAKASFASGLDKLEDSRDASASNVGEGDMHVGDESDMHVGEESGPEGFDNHVDSTVRPDSAWQTTDSEATPDTLSESAPEPHDPQAWANETDRPS